jgi:hypothetical protein
MILHRFAFGPCWGRALTATLLLAASALAWAQADPLARGLRQRAGGRGAHRHRRAHRLGPGQPQLARHHRHAAAARPGARAELDGGWLALRLQGPGALGTSALDDARTQWALTAGSASLRVRQPPAGERVELDTPQLALVTTQAGEYRLDVDAATDITRVTVRSGGATLYGQAGQSMPVAAGQQIVLAGRDLTVLSSASAPPRDAFGQWVAARERQRAQSPAMAYVSPDLPGYAQLDAYGQWSDDATYGPVWHPPSRRPTGRPTATDAGSGSTLGLDLGGRRALGLRALPLRPLDADRPALGLGARAGGAPSGVRAGAGTVRRRRQRLEPECRRAGHGLAPLAPGERWHPPYHASERHRDRLNDWGTGAGPIRRQAAASSFSTAPAPSAWRPRAASTATTGAAAATHATATAATCRRAGCRAAAPRRRRSARRAYRPTPSGRLHHSRRCLRQASRRLARRCTTTWAPTSRRRLRARAPGTVPGRCRSPDQHPSIDQRRPPPRQPEWTPPAPQARPAPPAWQPPRPAPVERPVEHHRPPEWTPPPRPAREVTRPERPTPPVERGREHERHPAPPQDPRSRLSNSDR